MQQKIVYLHGFASHWNPQAPKVKQLAPLGQVSGFNLNYCQSAQALVQKALVQAYSISPTLLVGCSMGAWLAAEMAPWLGIPFVALNPCIEPSRTLQKFKGQGIDFNQQPYHLKQEHIESYENINLIGEGIVFLDEEDELLNSQETKEVLEPIYPIISFAGGNHRFAHVPETLPHIQQWLKQRRPLQA
ncbi:MAG: YqiA/YcfP family alpha/beta fold hydrolase [Venatoribacter sp.]